MLLVLVWPHHKLGGQYVLFLVDSSPFAEDEELELQEREELKKLKKVFINPKIVEEEGEEWAFNEGCFKYS